MGLDMYLKAHKYLSMHDETEARIAGQCAELVGFENPFKVNTVTALSKYWRKANQVHGWFVDNVQRGEDDCREYYVSTGQIEELIAACERALQNQDAEVLSPRAGFFFGSTEVDDYYWQDLRDTAEDLRRVLANLPQGCWLTYQSSW